LGERRSLPRAARSLLVDEALQLAGGDILGPHLQSNFDLPQRVIDQPHFVVRVRQIEARLELVLHGSILSRDDRRAESRTRRAHKTKNPSVLLSFL